MLAVGASVMLAAAPQLEQQFNAHVDAEVGRQADAVLERLQEYRDTVGLPATVVVQIGDNGPLFSSEVAQLRSVLSGVPHVVLVNVREQVSWESQVNQLLQQAVRGWPQAKVADWNSASANPSLTYDGAHPDPAGALVYANVIARTLTRGSPASSQRRQPTTTTSTTTTSAPKH
jgi:hypothetical protein